MSPRSSSAPTSDGVDLLEPDDQRRLDEIATAFAAENRCPSVVWAIARSGRIVASGGLGDGFTTGPTGTRTAYRIASMTKSFSAAATLILRDDGVIALDAPVREYVPALVGLRSPTTDSGEVTLRDLLGMSSGLATDDPWADRHLDLTDAEFDRLIDEGPIFARTTGNGFEYSNFGYAVLGRIVGETTGLPIQTHVTDRLLRPLGLDGTDWTLGLGRHHATPVRRDGATPERPPLGDGLIAPMGGLWSTVDDLVTWATWLAEGFPARDGRDDGPLKRSSRREMQQPMRYAGIRTIRGVAAPSSYGYGLLVLDDPRHGTVVTHSGGLPGYGSNMRWTPGGHAVIVAVANRTYAPMADLTALLHDHAAETVVTPHPGGPDHPADPELGRLAERLIAVLQRWSRGEDVGRDALDDVFADNVEPDEAFEERAESFRRSGRLRFGEVSILGGASAAIAGATVDGGSARVDFTVSPARPFRVQHLALTVDEPS